MSRLLAKRKISSRKRRRLFVYWIIAFILIAAFFANSAKFFLGFLSNLSTPVGTKLFFEKFEGEKITAIIISDSLILATYDPQSRKVDIFQLPQNLYLDLGNTGFYLASKVNFLKADQSDGEGIKLLTASLMTNFKIPIDFYLDFGQNNINVQKVSEFYKEMEKPSSLLWFFKIPKTEKIMKTNITLFDQYRLYWQLRNIRKDKFVIENLPASNFEELILPDGGKAVKVIEDGLTPETLQAFTDFKVASEGLSVGVYNASDKAGLAQTIAKICQSLGTKAIIEGESERGQQTKILVKKNLLRSFTAKRLKKTFGGEITTQNDNTYTSDIVILAGQELAKRLSI